MYAAKRMNRWRCRSESRFERPKEPCILDGISAHVARLDDDTPANMALQLHINVSLNRPPDRTWRRPPGRPRNKWLDQLRNDSTRPVGELWRRAVDRGHGGATTRRPSPATRQWRRRRWWWYASAAVSYADATNISVLEHVIHNQRWRCRTVFVSTARKPQGGGTFRTPLMFPGVKMLRRPFIFWLYTCKNIIDDANRQSNMHMIACGIMSPKLENRPITRGRFNGSWEFEIVKVFVDLKAILKNIVEFIHS